MSSGTILTVSSQADFPADSVATFEHDPDPGKPLYPWQLYSLLGTKRSVPLLHPTVSYGQRIRSAACPDQRYLLPLL